MRSYKYANSELPVKGTVVTVYLESGITTRAFRCDQFNGNSDWRRDVTCEEITETVIKWKYVD